MDERKTISGLEFRLMFKELVDNLKDDDLVYFGSGDLSVQNPKERGPLNGPREVQIRFNELYTINPDQPD